MNNYYWIKETENDAWRPALLMTIGPLGPRFYLIGSNRQPKLKDVFDAIAMKAPEDEKI